VYLIIKYSLPRTLWVATLEMEVPRSQKTILVYCYQSDKYFLWKSSETSAELKIDDNELHFSLCVDVLKPPSIMLQIRERFPATVELSSGSNKVGVNSILLSANSEVFAKMLQSGMQESQKNVVQLEEGISTNVLEGFAQYIQDGFCPITGYDELIAVLLLAHQYQVLSLVSKVEECLSEWLDVGNCVELLLFSAKYQLDDLEEAAVRFFHENRGSVMKHEDFNQLLTAENAKQLRALLAE